MAPSLRALRQLADRLPPWRPVEPSPSSSFEGDEPFSDYLNHYQIDFQRQGLAVDHQVGVFSSGEYRVAAHCWWPQNPKGTVFLLHGYTDSVGLMRHPIQWLLTQGWCVVSFDLPGHGLSSGEPAAIGSFDDYRRALERCLELCEDNLPRPWLGAGQSTGCAVWLNYCATSTHQPLQVESLFLAAPLVRAARWWGIRALMAALGPWLTSVRRKFSENSHDAQFVDFVRHHDPLQPRHLPLSWIRAMIRWAQGFAELRQCSLPVTVVQGDSDGTVDADFNLKALKLHCTQADFHRLAGARHQLFNESEPYRDEVMGHLVDWLNSAALPNP